MQMRIVAVMPAKQTNTEHVIEIYRSATFLFFFIFLPLYL